MKYASAYKTKEYQHKSGFCDNSNYLIVNSVGSYGFNEFNNVVHRVNGRNDFYLSYNYDGILNVRLPDNIVHQVNPGYIFLYYPEDEQHYWHSGGQSLKNYWVHFTGYGVNELLKNTGLSNSNIFYAGRDIEIVALFEKIIDEVSSKRPCYEMLSASYLSQILSITARRISEQSSASAYSRNQKIYKTLQFIHTNYNQDISVKSLAKLNYLSNNRFSIIFKELVGVSPQQYIIDYRLRIAKELLYKTNIQVKQIAAMVGFKDPLYFSRLFRRYYKAKPSELIVK